MSMKFDQSEIHTHENVLAFSEMLFRNYHKSDWTISQDSDSVSAQGTLTLHHVNNHHVLSYCLPARADLIRYQLATICESPDMNMEH